MPTPWFQLQAMPLTIQLIPGAMFDMALDVRLRNIHAAADPSIHFLVSQRSVFPSRQLALLKQDVAKRGQPLLVAWQRW